MSIDILFIHPGNHKKTYQGLSKEFTAIATPTWTAILAHYIRKRGFATAIYDVNVEGWDEDSAKEVLSRYNPNLIVMMVYGHNPSASTQTMPAAGRIAKDLKMYNRDIPIAMGGTHPSALPLRTLREESIDYVVQGEGANTIEGLIQYIKGKQDINKVKGVWFKDGEIRFSSPAPLIENIDEEFDMYAWDLLPPLKNYRTHNMHCFQEFYRSKKEDFSDVRSPYAVLYTSLGCPFSCHYCCIHAVYGKQGIRYWSLNSVMSWIDVLVDRYGVKNIRLDDELFILSPARVERFCDMLIERDYNLNLWVYGRVDTIKMHLLRKLKKAGINWICLGIESASERVRQDVNKNLKGDVGEVVRDIQSNGIYVLGNYMFGLPEDSLETMQATLEQAMNLNCEFVNFYTVMAYPGSKLYKDALQDEEGLLLPDSWDGFSQHSYQTKPLPTRYLTPQEVLRFRDYAFYTYYKNPLYLEKIEELFGKRVRKHIEKMVSIRIKRRLLEEEVYV